MKFCVMLQNGEIVDVMTS